MTHIPVERLTTATYIAIPGYDGVQVMETKFDGYGYSITVCTDDRYGWDATDLHYVECGGSVEYAGRGEPMLRDPDLAELEALDEARAAQATLTRATNDFCVMLTGRYADSVREGLGEQPPPKIAAE